MLFGASLLRAMVLEQGPLQLLQSTVLSLGQHESQTTLPQEVMFSLELPSLMHRLQCTQAPALLDILKTGVVILK